MKDKNASRWLAGPGGNKYVSLSAKGKRVANKMFNEVEREILKQTKGGQSKWILRALEAELKRES